jgi:phosphatidylglycerol lysyltransferase
LPRLVPLFPATARLLQPLVPRLLSALVFAAGALLLLSVSTPGVPSRLLALKPIVPLPLLELSHLAAGLLGLALVILAHALSRRVESAWALALALLSAGAVAALLKGWDWEEALVLTLVLAAVAASRRAFYRPGSIGDSIRSPVWLAVALGSIALMLLTGFLSYADVDYRNALWWHMGYRGDASRFLRVALLVGAAGAALVLARLLRPARPPASASQPDPVIADIVAASPATSAHLAFTGDKQFLRSASGRSFLMYQVEGRSWIAMGDPVGPEDEWPALILALRDLADRHGGRAVFYQAAPETLGAYADAGLVPHKLGEEARVPLAAFSLEGPRAKPFRHARRAAEREGLRFEIVPAACVPALIDELAQVSRAWLAEHPGSEKGFSLGRFDPGYLARFDLALLRKGAGIIAFANIWRSANREEFSIDLMRYLPDAPGCTMRALFLELILEAQREGFRWFNLGMAPLAGLQRHRLAPLWHRVGRLLFDHGERFYGFEGLRRFKQDFDPVWRPRYLCCAPGLAALAVALGDVARLIARPPTPAATGAAILLLPERRAA